jgi:hypothetical protein
MERGQEAGGMFQAPRMGKHGRRKQSESPRHEQEHGTYGQWSVVHPTPNSLYPSLLNSKPQTLYNPKAEIPHPNPFNLTP